jgi:MbtH protein
MPFHGTVRREVIMGVVNEEGAERYVVVVNDEEQYSIWRIESPVPSGWQAVGKVGNEKECLDHIERIWTDMRPRSLR